GATAVSVATWKSGNCSLQLATVLRRAKVFYQTSQDPFSSDGVLAGGPRLEDQLAAGQAGLPADQGLPHPALLVGRLGHEAGDLPRLARVLVECDEHEVGARGVCPLAGEDVLGLHPDA